MHLWVDVGVLSMDILTIVFEGCAVVRRFLFDGTGPKGPYNSLLSCGRKEDISPL